MPSQECLSPYVSNLDQKVYALRNLPPEVVAVLFAYVSRSPASFRDNLAKLMADGDLQSPLAAQGAFQESKASSFHEKWVIGYGHSSVAEHATLHFAIEDLSILGAKVIEDSRLAAFTEKSSRYQVFDANRFHWPAELQGHPLETEARALVGRLFALYGELYHDILAGLEASGGKPDKLGARAWKQTLHAAACDEVRYLLPAGSMTSLGMTLNARSAAHLIRKLRAHPLAEMRQLGNRLEEEGRKVTPVLLKYSQPGDWQHQWESGQMESPRELDPGPGLPRLRVIDAEADAERLVLADLRSQLLDEDLASARHWANSLSNPELSEAYARLFAGMSSREIPPRALEKAEITIECCVDYGAYRDLQRHRMLSPTLPLFGCRWGYELPARLARHERLADIRTLLDESGKLWRKLAEWNPAVASYVVPMAWRYRFLMRMNLRQAEHMIRLRSAAAGHPSYRRVAQDLYRELELRYPELVKGFRVDLADHAWAREEDSGKEKEM